MGKTAGPKGTSIASRTAALGLALAMALSACSALQTPEQKLDAALAADPHGNRIMSALAADFPQDHTALRAQMIQAMEANATPAELKTMFEGRVQSVLAENKRHIADAPDRELAAVLRSQLGAAEAIRGTSVADCARFAMGGTVRYDSTNEPTRDAMTRSMVDALHAASAGRAHPEQRPTGNVAQADIDAFIAGMRRAGADQPTIDAALGTGFISRPVEQQCNGSIAMLRALQGMGGTGLDLLARVLRNSN